MQNVSANCDDTFITEKDLRLILLTKGLTGAASLIGVVLSMIMLLLFARFKPQYLKEITVTERLLLYHGLATIFRAISTILQTMAVEYNDNDVIQTGLCNFTGFLDQWSVWVVLLSIQMLVLHILIHFLNDDLAKKPALEVFYIAFPIVFPLLFSWIPFILDGYGLAGGWCWIRRKPGNCNIGVVWQFIFWFAPLIIFQILDVLALFVAYPALFRNKRKKKVFDKENGWILLKLHGPFLSLIFLSIIVNWFSVANRLYIAFSNRHNLVSWCFHAIMASCWGILAAIVIFFYLLSLIASQQSSHNSASQTNKKDSFGNLSYLATTPVPSTVLKQGQADSPL